MSAMRSGWPGRKDKRFPTGHSAVKLSGSIWMLLSPIPCRYVPQEAKLERALGLSLVDQLPIMSPTAPPQSRFLRCQGERNTECALPDSQGQMYLWLWDPGLGNLALGYLLNEQVLELTSNWRLINHHITKGMGEHLHVIQPSSYTVSSRYPGPQLGLTCVPCGLTRAGHQA